LNGLIDAAREFGRDQEGASIVEYALFIALITIVCLVGMTLLGAKINNFLGSFATTI